jgi:hypothetical protein
MQAMNISGVFKQLHKMKGARSYTHYFIGKGFGRNTD